MNNSFNNSTLSRCQTPNLSLVVTNRASPSPKCFGIKTHISKEDYKRDRDRWQQKLEEAEKKLTEASINNSELFLIKAELNRKIIDFEKNQRPLSEQNRRLNERIRLLNVEVKKLEEKLSYAKDDLLSLRDAYDRLVKENLALKEQRAFPEKIEELSRYRNQVLEYSKCITALRQSAIEKDRRYDILFQKFKKYRKTLKRNEVSEDDHQSYIGSESSMETSSVCLDTITEDFDENFDIELSDLSNSTTIATENSFKQQLDLANTTIVKLQNTIDESNSIKSTQNSIIVERLNKQITELKESKKKLETELANVQNHNELLEFQLTEITEGFKYKKKDEFCDKQCSTNIEFTDQNEILLLNLKKIKDNQLTIENLDKIKKYFQEFLYCNSATFNNQQLDFIKYAIEVIEILQNEQKVLSTKFNETANNIENLKFKNEANTLIDIQKKELNVENDQLKINKQKTLVELQQIKEKLEIKSKKILKKELKIQQLTGELEKMAKKVKKQAVQIFSNENTISKLNEQFKNLEVDFTNICANFTNSEKKDGVVLKVSNIDIVKKIENLKLENTNLKLENEKQKNENFLFKNQVNTLTNQFNNLKENYAQKEVTLEQLKILSNKFQLEAEEEKTKNQRLEADLIEANIKIKTLNEQIRPIGSQLERRYEESRYRLSEALKRINDLEKNLLEVNQKVVENTNHSHKIKQLETYNTQLEEQFNAQMDIIAALKKKFLTIKTNAKSVDSINWTSNSSEGTNSLDDEQYHSEGSDTCRLPIKVE